MLPYFLYLFLFNCSLVLSFFLCIWFCYSSLWLCYLCILWFYACAFVFCAFFFCSCSFIFCFLFHCLNMVARARNCIFYFQPKSLIFFFIKNSTNNEKYKQKQTTDQSQAVWIKKYFAIGNSDRVHWRWILGLNECIKDLISNWQLKLELYWFIHSLFPSHVFNMFCIPCLLSRNYGNFFLFFSSYNFWSLFFV